MVGLTAQKHQIPGYTGFIPGGQHQMAKTYGHASQDAMTERQANDDPQKWRKFVSYAEFTPAHTPAEEHHIPGYSGHVPGVYSENLYAKTYGKTTLQAVRGSHAKGCEQDPDEQYRTSTMTHMGDTASHPGKPQDIMPGGVSWTGASPYNMNDADGSRELEPVAPWPPSNVQIASGKEPPQPSPLLRNYPPSEGTTKPALLVTPKADPHDPASPEKKQMSLTKGNYHVPGYSGFVPGVQSENLFAGTYAKITSSADTIRDRKLDSAVQLSTANMNESGVISLKSASSPRPRSNELRTTRVDGPAPHQKHVPGYTGFVPGVHAENIYAKTYGHASQLAIAGDHKRYQWTEQDPSERFLTSSQAELKDFGHPAKIEDGHVTYEHEHRNPARANYQRSPNKGVASALPGYGGFVPGVQAKNMFGKTQLETTAEALQKFNEQKQAQRASTAPSPDPWQKPDVGMLQFKPNGFLYQKRMQGEWNNGMLGSRNYSAVKLAEGNIWKDELYKKTSLESHQGHKESDVPTVYSKGPQPKFLNMDEALKHKSVYMGYCAL
mmetsp:Transcript_36015/g.75732  ORF Transcript_36015/g.75732 Transcript_36015/m.75732 type:complete len:551 (+) Transcript_36015:120-1772(+)